MKKYVVYVPFTGFTSVEVEANTETEAIETALENVSFSDVEEGCQIEFHKRIVSGNVFYGAQNEAEVEELDD